MNLSGECVRELLDYYKVDETSGLIVLSDDVIYDCANGFRRPLCRLIHQLPLRGGKTAQNIIRQIPVGRLLPHTCPDPDKGIVSQMSNNIL